MNNRDISISLCGIVMGIMLGATATGLQDLSLQATVPVPMRPTDIVNQIQIDQRSELHTAAKTSVSGKVTTPLQSSVACVTMKEVYGQVLSAVTIALPTIGTGATLNAAPAASIKIVLDAQLHTYCGPNATVTLPKINNHCYQFRATAARYTQCRNYEQAGVQYPSDDQNHH